MTTETDLRIGRRLFRLLAPLIGKRWRLVATASGAMAAEAAIDVLKPWPMKFVLDYVLKDRSFVPDWLMPPGSSRQTWLLGAVCIAVLALGSLGGLSAYLREYRLRRLGEEVAFDLRAKVFGHLNRVSLAFHDSSRTGDLITRVTTDTRAVRDMVSSSLIKAATGAVTLIAMLTTMLFMDAQLALVGLVTVPVLLPTVWNFRRRMRRAARDVRKAEVDVTSRTQEAMSTVRLIRSLGRERFEQERFTDDTSRSVDANLKAARVESAYSWAVKIIEAAATAVLLYWGVQLARTGRISPGDLVVFVSYLRNLYSPMRDMAKQSMKVSEAMAGVERILDVLAEPGVRDDPRAGQAPRFKGAIAFYGVSFGYEPGRAALRDVSFEIEPGRTVVLVGPNGAGKSTVLSLIARLYDPASGEVTIDGQDIRSFRLASLRERMSIVLQDTVLLQASVYENIRYGRPGASREEVEAAADAAGLADLAARLPEGLDTVVGPRGATLSGGERQRVSIARAIVRDAPILLLDEPTTGLDSEGERLVVDAIRKLMHGRTTLIATHNTALAEGSDVVLHLDGGRLVSGRSAPPPRQIEAIDASDGSRPARMSAELKGGPTAFRTAVEQVSDPHWARTFAEASLEALGSGAHLEDAKIEFAKIRTPQYLDLAARLELNLPDGAANEAWLSASVLSSVDEARMSCPWPAPDVLERVRARGFKRAAAVLGDTPIVVRAYPFDPSLPQLSFIDDHERMDRLIAHRVDPVDGESLRVRSRRIVHYKPGRSCMFRFDLASGGALGSNVAAFGKAYGDDRGERTAAMIEAVWHASVESDGSWGAAQPAGYVAPLRMVLQHEAPGDTLRGLLFRFKRPTPDQLSVMDRQMRSVARALCEFQRDVPAAHEPRKTFEQMLASRYELIPYLYEVDPELGDQAADLLAEFSVLARRSRAGPAVFSHGDLSVANVLISDDRVCFVDLDRGRSAEPVHDPGYLLAQLMSYGIRHKPRQADVTAHCDAFVDTYLGSATNVDPDRLALSTAVYLVDYVIRRSRKPYARLRSSSTAMPGEGVLWAREQISRAREIVAGELVR